MTFKEEMEKEGERLYKWRSYIPLLFLLLLPIAFKNGEFIERIFGDRIGDLWEGIAFIISFLGFIGAVLRWDMCLRIHQAALIP